MDKANAVEIDDPQKAPEPDRDKQEAAEKLVANSAWTLCNKGKAHLRKRAFPVVYLCVLLSVLGPHMPLPSDVDLCKCSFPKVADQDVLLSVLGPHMALPSDIDLCKCSFPKMTDQESLAVSFDSMICSHGASSISNSLDEAKRKIDASEAATRKDVLQDAKLQFAPRDLSKIVLTSVSNYFTGDSTSLNSGCGVSKVNKISNNNF
ncbi:hypothetical protein MUK42_07299 [Musa troglodytarum]|uniref:Uncharacterized protein n=1 Tax=Musa troglodytarum TaxID=320322 RepID=A0A9E7GF17_9LILI|nr:hypothetical protein MUK42_07299 [Musa troglodytarum]